MGKEQLEKIKNRIEDRMLIGTLYDLFMMKTKYRSPMLSTRYNIMIAQKHRMLYYKKIKNKYYQKCTSVREWEKAEKKRNSDTVWVCWLQGMEQAPEVVKRCYESLQKNLPQKKIVVLDQDSIFDYIELPDYIIEKWKQGIIAPALFSDLVRLELLIQYGGYWIDATVLCTDARWQKQIEETSLFMYSFYYFDFNPEIMQLNNWFIYSESNNNILCLIRELLHTYWKHENRALDYFIFQLITTMALEYYEEDAKKMPIVSQVDAHVLATYIFDEYDPVKYELLKGSTGIHKLSTRFEPEGMEKEGTFYDVVIKQGKY